MTKIKHIINLYRAEPFRPFVLKLEDGRKVAVKRRELMCRAPSGRMIAVYEPGGRLHFIELASVATIQADKIGRNKKPKK